jgi:hypothetical protein
VKQGPKISSIGATDLATRLGRSNWHVPDLLLMLGQKFISFAVAGWILLSQWLAGRQLTAIHTHKPTDRPTVRTRTTEIKLEWTHPSAQNSLVIVSEKNSVHALFLSHIFSPLKNWLCRFTGRFWIIYCAFRNLFLIHRMSSVSGMRCCIIDRQANEFLVISVGKAFRLCSNAF